MMNFAQFKRILGLAETLTGIWFTIFAKPQMMDQVACNFCECDNEDNHFYAILADGRDADDEYETCAKSALRTAYKITATDDAGTYFYLSNAAKKDGALLEAEIESEIMLYLWEYTEEDKDYTAEELIAILEAAIAEKAA